MYSKIPLLLLIITLFSCNSDNGLTPVETSPVQFDINAELPSNLTEFNFFEGELKNLDPVFGVIPYDVITPLFTDYAHKKRFIWMPDNVNATFNSDGTILSFPTSTILIKSFYYNNVQPTNTTRIIETRLMIKKEDGWIFADYIWNDEQTEAFLDLSGSNTNVEWTENGVTRNISYRIPTENECFICHKNGTEPTPIGLKPQNLNKSISYEEEGNLNQLQKLIDFGYLEDNMPTSINTVVDWEDSTQPIDLRMRSYVDMNCAHCHSDLRHCDYRPLRLAYNETDDNTNLGVCVDADTSFPGLSTLIVPGNKNRSVLYYRLNSVQEDERMPLLGRTILHDEALDLVDEWINSISTDCE